MVQLFMNAVLFHRVCGSADVSFYGLDGDYCFVATETQQNIQRLWFELVGGSEMATAPAGAGPGDRPVLREPGFTDEPQPASGVPAMPPSRQ